MSLASLRRATVVALAALSEPADAFQGTAVHVSQRGGEHSQRSSSPRSVMFPFDPVAAAAAIEPIVEADLPSASIAAAGAVLATDPWTELQSLATPESHMLFLTSALAAPMNWALNNKVVAELPPQPRLRGPTKSDRRATATEPLKCPVKKAMRYMDMLDDALTTLQDTNTAENPFLQGNFAPVAHETPPTRMELAEGAVPADLPAGVFLRNGPNPVPNHAAAKRLHWFDGHGMVHAVRISPQGDAAYSSTWLETERYKFETQHGRAFFTSLGELVGLAGVLKAMLIAQAKCDLADVDLLRAGQANTALLSWNGRLFALQETGLPFECALNEDGTLRSIGFTDFDGLLDFPFSAHPKLLPTGELAFHGYMMGPEGSRKWWGLLRPESQAGDDGDDEGVELVTKVDLPSEFSAGLAHDMAVTEQHAVLFDPSITVSLEQAGQSPLHQHPKPSLFGPQQRPSGRDSETSVSHTRRCCRATLVASTRPSRRGSALRRSARLMQATCSGSPWLSPSALFTRYMRGTRATSPCFGRLCAAALTAAAPPPIPRTWPRLSSTAARARPSCG